MTVDVVPCEPVFARYCLCLHPRFEFDTSYWSIIVNPSLVAIDLFLKHIGKSD